MFFRNFLIYILVAFFALNANAIDFNVKKFDSFSRLFTNRLKENSLKGTMCVVSENSRRIAGNSDFEELLMLGKDSAIIINYAAFLLENENKFDRQRSINEYFWLFAKVADKNCCISFSDLISSTSSIDSNLDKIIPKDASELELFDFAAQMSKNPIKSEYSYSKLSIALASYSLAYSYSKNDGNLSESFNELMKFLLNDKFSSLKICDLKYDKLAISESVSLNIKDVSEFLALQIKDFSGVSETEEIKLHTHKNAWLYTKLKGVDMFIAASTLNKKTHLIAVVPKKKCGIAIFIDAQSDKGSAFCAGILDRFIQLINN